MADSLCPLGHDFLRLFCGSTHDTRGGLFDQKSFRGIKLASGADCVNFPRFLLVVCLCDALGEKVAIALMLNLSN